MIWNFLCKREAKGVCLIRSLEEHFLPRKVKISVVTHRFGCKGGLCSITDLVCFHFRCSKWQARLRQCMEARGEELGPYQWMSREASLDVDKLYKHQEKAIVRMVVTWRHCFWKKPPPMYIPMDTFLAQVLPDLQNGRLFTLKVWLQKEMPAQGENLLVPEPGQKLPVPVENLPEPASGHNLPVAMRN